MRLKSRDSARRAAAILSLTLVLTLGSAARADHCPSWLEGLCQLRDAIGECKDALVRNWMTAGDQCAKVREAMGGAASGIIPDSHARAQSAASMRVQSAKGNEEIDDKSRRFTVSVVHEKV